MRLFFKKYRFQILFAILGVIGGYMYWKFIGCSSGHCLITSRWYNSSIYGALMGYLFGGVIEDFLKKRKTKEQELNQ